MSYPAHAGYPVRCGSSVRSPMSLEYWIARSSRAMTGGRVTTQLHDPAARGARVVLESFAQENEGVGNAGCPLHPQPVCIGSKHTVVTAGTPEHPAFPHAMVLTAYVVLSPATNSSCHRHRRIKVLPNPVGPTKTSADLTPATGARTTRFCRTRPVFAKRLRRAVHLRRNFSENGSSIVRLRAANRSRGSTRPAIAMRPTLPRPPHPTPRP
jgi:hypothetical protein